MYPNYYCLDRLLPTDAESLASEALNCDANNPGRIAINYYFCTEIHQVTDQIKARELMDLAMTPMGEEEVQVLENAASILYFSCRL